MLVRSTILMTFLQTYYLRVRYILTTFLKHLSQLPFYFMCEVSCKHPLLTFGIVCLTLPPPTEFIQPQNLWPYIQQNLIQQNHLTNPAFITNNHHHHSHHLHPNSNNLVSLVNGVNNNNNNNGSDSNVSCNNNNSSPEHHVVDSRDNKVIAKPLPSRPFMHHGINHPHLHSLLAHCRNPYMTGK